jgi:hypothetical protein
VAFSGDSRTLAANGDGLVHLWSAGDWKQLRAATTVDRHFPSYAISPDSRVLAYTTTPYEVCLEELETGKQLAILEAPDDLHVSGVGFDHDGGRLIVATGYPPTARLWDLRRIDERLASIGLDAGLGPRTPAATAVARPKRIIFDEGLSAANYASRADGFRNRHEYEKAAADWLRALAKEPENADVLRKLAWVLAIGPSTVREPQRAEKLARQACELAPDNCHSWYALACARFRLGQYPDALAALKQAESLTPKDDPKLSRGWGVAYGFLWAMTHHRLGESDQAKAAYDQTLKWLAGRRSALDPAYLYEAEALQAEAAILLGK